MNACKLAETIGDFDRQWLFDLRNAKVKAELVDIMKCETDAPPVLREFCVLVSRDSQAAAEYMANHIRAGLDNEQRDFPVFAAAAARSDFPLATFVARPHHVPLCYFAFAVLCFRANTEAEPQNAAADASKLCSNFTPDEGLAVVTYSASVDPGHIFIHRTRAKCVLDVFLRAIRRHGPDGLTSYRRHTFRPRVGMIYSSDIALCGKRNVLTCMKVRGLTSGVEQVYDDYFTSNGLVVYGPDCLIGYAIAEGEPRGCMAEKCVYFAQYASANDVRVAYCDDHKDRCGNIVDLNVNECEVTGCFREAKWGYPGTFRSRCDAHVLCEMTPHTMRGCLVCGGSAASGPSMGRIRHCANHMGSGEINWSQIHFITLMLDRAGADLVAGLSEACPHYDWRATQSEWMRDAEIFRRSFYEVCGRVMW